MSRLFMILILCIGCAAESEPEPSEPLKCENGGIIETSAGERLHVKCNQDVTAPPVYCERLELGSYACDIYHATPEDCEVFKGLCEAS